MTGLLLAFLTTLAVGLGARDQMLLAAMTARQGQRPALLVTALICAFGTTVLAAAASGLVASKLNADARLVFAGIALAIAGAELVLSRPFREPREPTHSLGAFAVVLLAQQATDAVRFLVLAIAVLVRAPIAAGLGGGAGALVLALGAWLGSEALLARKLIGMRRVLGALILALAVWVILRGMGRI